MKLRYFIVDATGQLRKITQAAVHDLWKGQRRAHALGGAGAKELKLVSVACTDDLLPQRIYLLRMPLTAGLFTLENYLCLQLLSRSDCVAPNEMIQHHTEGWPSDFFSQLAVALDVTLSNLQVPLSVGGPLFTAAAMSVTPRQALRYLR